MKNTVNYKRFLDLREFLDFIEPLPAMASGSPSTACYRSWDIGTAGGFFGCKSFADARNVLERGWGSGAARVLEMRASLDHLVQAASTAKASAMGWACSGEWLHIGRAVSGMPNCFSRVVDSGSDTCDRVITVAMNASCSASTNKDAIFMRGAVALCLVDVLETLGHRVELLYATCARRSDASNVYDEFNCVVKKPSEHIDIDRLAFLFCHRDSTRRMCFRYYEHHGRQHSGMPSPLERTATDFPGCVIVPEIKPPNSPEDVVRSCLKAAGVTIDLGYQEEK